MDVYYAVGSGPDYDNEDDPFEAMVRCRWCDIVRDVTVTYASQEFHCWVCAARMEGWVPDPIVAGPETIYEIQDMYNARWATIANKDHGSEALAALRRCRELEPGTTFRLHIVEV